MAVISATSLIKGVRPASELAEVIRRALDAQLGIALQDQLPGPDLEADDASRVIGDFFAIAARHDGPVALNDDEYARLTGLGRSEQHMRKLDLFVRANGGKDPLTDHHLKLQIEAMGLPFRPTQVEADRVAILTAWADAQHRASMFHSGLVQQSSNPVDHLLKNRPTNAPENVPPTFRDADDVAHSRSNRSEASTSDREVPLLSSIIPQIIKGIVGAGKWRAGPGSTAEEAERVFRQLCWMIGDFPVDQYTQGHLATFEREMMAMPKTVRVQKVWDKTYAEAKAEFPKLTVQNRRNPRTMNKDLSYLSTIADRMSAEGYWIKGAMKPLALAHTVSAKQKARAKSPWTVTHVVQMLSSPIYSGNRGSKRRLKGGDLTHHDAAYWLLPIAIYTGACQEELCGLLLDDIKVVDTAIPHLVIEPNRLRSLKRDARERFVPLHPRLIELGFLDYVSHLRAEGSTELFPELWINAGKRGGDQYRAIVWDKLIDWLKAQGTTIPVGIKGKAADFHSLRSTMLSQLDRHDINQNIVKDIVGHAREGVTAESYQDLAASGGLDEALRERLMVIERLPDFARDVSPCAPRLLPLALRSR